MKIEWHGILLIFVKMPDLYSLDYLYQMSDNKCGIIAVQGNEDWMVDYKEKQYFIEKIPHGQMMLVTSEDVDGQYLRIQITDVDWITLSFWI